MKMVVHSRNRVLCGSEMKSLDISLSLSGAKSFQLIDNLLFVLDTDVCFWYFFSVSIYCAHSFVT